MRKYSSNLAFVDLLFNLLVGFTSLFVISFLLINPIAKKGVVDPPIRFMIELKWADESPNDIDLYIKGPTGSIIYYANRENGYITLKRDDLGLDNDIFEVNGKLTKVLRNYEVTTMSTLPDGDYVINVHFFAKRKNGPDFEPVEVRVTSLQPYIVIHDSTISLESDQERTILTFTVKDGRISEKRDDIQVKLRRSKMERGSS